MRDAATGFYVGVLKKLIAEGTVSISDSVLVVCGGPLDEKVMALVGFQNVAITNLDDRMSNNFQDAENLTYENESFDLVIVHAGLHHCYSPHRALLEMYRVARKCAVAFEARDSLLMRLAIRFGLTEDYEIGSVAIDREKGGLANGPIPNFIYRWTERGVRDTIASYDPAHAQKIEYYYGLRLPIQRWSRAGSPLRFVGLLIEPLSDLFIWMLPKQCNQFAFAILKTEQLKPWMESKTRIAPRYAVIR